MKKRCAVCGDTTKLNVRLAWRRDRDGKTVNVCYACAESNRVNENSIDNFTTVDTIYIKEESGRKMINGNARDTQREHYRSTRSAFGKVVKKRMGMRSIVVDTTIMEVEMVFLKEGAPKEVKELVNNFNNASGKLLLEVTPCGGDSVDMAIELGDYEITFPKENEYSSALKEVLDWVWIGSDCLKEIK